MITLIEAYREARKPTRYKYDPRKVIQATAQSAITQARYRLRAKEIRRQWRDMGGETYADYDVDNTSSHGMTCNHDATVRLVCSPDEWADFEDMCGDTFNPDANPDIKPEILEREKQEYADKLNRDGVWVFEAQYWNGEQWETVGSIGWIEGGDDEIAGYDVDLMSAAMDARREHVAQQARDLEETRPDMYGT